MKLIRVIVYTIALFFLFSQGVFASESFLIATPPKDISVGDTATIVVSASSTNQALNAVSGTLQLSGGATITAVSKQGSIVDFWTTEPHIVGNQVRFEGVVLNPGYQGQGGKLFTITLNARKEGTATIFFSDGAILANDGLGSNIIDSLASKVIRIIASSSIKVDTIPNKPIATVVPTKNGKVLALPVITEYSQSVDSVAAAYIKGKGEPNALTKLSFKDTSLKSLGEQFIIALQTKKNKPTEALIKNDANGQFQYLSPNNLVAGAYNVTPYLVDEDTQTQKPGFGVQVLVNNSKVVKWLVVFINVLALLIPVVCLGIIIYFIPWYSRLRMKILHHKIALENEKITLSEKELQLQEERLRKT
jgi:hypothetical protein